MSTIAINESIVPPGYAPHYRDFITPILWYYITTLGLNAFTVVACTLLLTIFLSTSRFRKRKEGGILASNLLVNVFFGGSFALNSVRSLWIYYNAGAFVKLLTPLECVLKPDVLLQIYTLPCSVTVTLALTIDRWYAITRLTGYTNRSYRYVAMLILIAYAIPLAFVVWVIRYAVTGYPSGYMVNQYCVFPLIMPKALERSQECFVLSMALTALVLYVPIIKQAYKLYQNRKNLAYSKRQERDRALRTTLTVVLIMLSYLLLVALPNIIFLLDHNYQFTLPLLVVRTFKGVADVLIYVLTQRDLRRIIFCRGQGHFQVNSPTTVLQRSTAR